ncbi:MAG: alcohol dehydrogenase [Promethearchaeota archaeon]|nr:MAG: alcohol dehydrogenase [Candidatus Lokiarchaeota archaeon]
MKAVELSAKWDPKPNFKLGFKDIEGKLTYLGSQVWRYPEVKVVDNKVKPKILPNEVMIKVNRCGICGSDVHMLQTYDDGYIYYPGLTAFPVVLGHEFAGEIVEVGNKAFSKRTGKLYEVGEPVTVEEMVWCGECKPCCDGYPNHCERLQEIGFSIDGAYAEYIAVPAKLCWSLKKLEKQYSDIYKIGSLVEPTSVAYNAVIERGGGIRPGENVVILGGGPIGLAAASILKFAGAGVCIISEPDTNRANLAKKVGSVDYTINPMKESFVEKVKEYTDNEGAALYLEATGLPHVVTDDIQNAIWECKAVNSTVVIVARAEQRMPVCGEYFQVRRARIVGAQGHSGHGTFPNVINCMAAGMDITPIITKEITLEEVPENIAKLQTDRENCKISAKIA